LTPGPAAQTLGVVRRFYDRWMPELWAERVALVRGRSQVFQPCFRDTGSIFIHVPKAAGTSISTALYGGNIGHRFASDYQRISAREFRRYFRFAFVRNPWDRVVSAYVFARQGGTSRVQPIPNPVYQGAEFRSFGVFVRQWLAHADLLEEDVVFTPQWRFICDDRGEVIVDHVGKVENLAADMAVVEKRLGRAIRLDDLNRTNRDTDHRTYYDEEAREIVARVYARDIEMFGYGF
jgi:hypothetical protein